MIILISLGIWFLIGIISLLIGLLYYGNINSLLDKIFIISLGLIAFVGIYYLILMMI
jgi:hypothetical protein